MFNVLCVNANLAYMLVGLIYVVCCYDVSSCKANTSTIVNLITLSTFLCIRNFKILSEAKKSRIARVSGTEL